jgi:hypothetical protein
LTFGITKSPVLASGVKLMIDFTLATVTVLFVLALLGAETLGRTIAIRMPCEDVKWPPK